MRKTLKNLTVSVAALAASPFLLSVNTQAQSKTATVKATINESLSLTLSSNSMNFELSSQDLVTNYIDVTGRTNSVNGYTISFNANNDYNDLKHSNALIDDLIASVSDSHTESTFPEKSWGYSTDTADYAFRKIPLAAKNIFATAEIGENTHKFTVGIKGSDNLAAGDYENDLLFTIIANPVIPDSDEGYDNDVQDPIFDSKAKAILGTNGNLNFIYDDSTYTVGNTYTDNLGETTISSVFNVPTNGCTYEICSWTNNDESVKTANFSDSFKNFKPTSTRKWFAWIRQLSALTNPQNLNTSEVTNMSRMFDGAGYLTGLSLDLTSWDVSSVTNMNRMFSQFGQGGKTLSLNLNNWDVSNVKNMGNMFDNVGYDSAYVTINADNWNAINVADISGMFNMAGMNYNNNHGVNDSELNISIKNFRAPRAKTANNMFYESGWNMNTTNIDARNLNISNVGSTYRMFEETAKYAKNVNLNLSGWDLSSTKNMSEMFDNAGYGAEKLTIDMTSWKLGHAENMKDMFKNVYGGECDRNGRTLTHNYMKLDGIDTWDVSTVKTMEGMFKYVGSYSYTDLALNIDGWNVQNLEDTTEMFADFGRNAETIVLNLKNWNTPSLKKTTRMFSNVGTGQNKSVKIDVSNWDVDQVEDMSLMFAGVTGNTTTDFTLDLTGWNVSAGTNTNYMFSGTGFASGWVAPSWYND